MRSFYQKLKGSEFKYLHLPGVSHPSPKEKNHIKHPAYGSEAPPPLTLSSFYQSLIFLPFFVQAEESGPAVAFVKRQMELMETQNMNERKAFQTVQVCNPSIL